MNIEEAARESSIKAGYNPDSAADAVGKAVYEIAFITGAKWQREEAIESLSSVLGNWVHGGDADCIIAEFERRLDK